MKSGITKIVPFAGGVFAFKYTNWRERRPNAAERYEAGIRSTSAKPVVEFDLVEVVRL